MRVPSLRKAGYQVLQAKDGWEATTYMTKLYLGKELLQLLGDALSVDATALLLLGKGA